VKWLEADKKIETLLDLETRGHRLRKRLFLHICEFGVRLRVQIIISMHAYIIVTRKTSAIFDVDTADVNKAKLF
jgi:hypothetical protein